MQRDFNHYVRHKKRRNRFIALVLVTLTAAATAVLIRDCAQSIDEPYNKEYKPMDKLRDKDNTRGVF